MKKSLKYIILVFIFIVLIVSSTVSILFVKYKDHGKFNVIRKKFDVVFTNGIVFDDSSKIKINNDNDTLHISIDKLASSAEFSIEIKNIANIDAILKNYSYSNIDTNASDDEVSIIVNINNGDIIKKGESKKLSIVVKNNTNRDDIYYNFNINCLFEEYNLLN